jgi:hypothetical protein
MNNGLDQRVGNSERELYVAHLAAMVSEGFLKDDEFSERRDKALEAVVRADLARLVADLPPVPSASTQVLVQRQVAGEVEFSLRRWVTSIGIGLGLIFAAGPFWAAAAHGLDHTPMDGSIARLGIFLGVITVIVLGLVFAPGEMPELRDKDWQAVNRAHNKRNRY